MLPPPPITMTKSECEARWGGLVLQLSRRKEFRGWASADYSASSWKMSVACSGRVLSSWKLNVAHSGVGK